MREAGPAGVLADRFAVLILAAVAITAALTFRDYGLGWDDYTHSQYGDLLLKLYGSGFADRRALSFVNLYMYGGGFDMASTLAAKVSPFGLFATRRLVGAAVGIAGLIGAWRLGRRLGGPLGGASALTLLAACPLYYGHMFMNAKDTPFAAAMIVLLLGVARAFDEYPRPGLRTLALIALALGAAFGSRILAVLAAPSAAAGLLLIFAEEARGDGLRAAGARLGQFVLRVVPALVLAYLIMGLLWPWGVLAPLNPVRAAFYFDKFFERPWKELYEGALIAVPDMPASYLPHLLLLKLPLTMLALGITGGVAALIALARAAARSIAQAAAVLAAGIAAPVIGMARLHPYEYVYFNALAGGARGAQGRYMLDYWGLAFKQAAEALRGKLAAAHAQPPAGRRWVVAVCGPQAAAEQELGPQFETTFDEKKADFAMSLGTFYCRVLSAPPIAEVRRDGIVFARVYDLRGRPTPDLLTMPPP